MFRGPWDSTLIMMGVPSLKMGVPSFYIYKRRILEGSTSFREGIGTGLSYQTGVANIRSFSYLNHLKRPSQLDRNLRSFFGAVFF